MPNSPYERYIEKDLNFEDVCYRCVYFKKPFHTYIHPERYCFWVDMYMMPIAADEGDTYYFVYTMEVTPDAETDRLSNIDSSVYEAVLRPALSFGEPRIIRIRWMRLSAISVLFVRLKGYV